MTNGPLIRPLRTDADRHACVELQRLTWGAAYDEIVPPSILVVTQKIGGVAAGAFGTTGQLLGFVFGMAGVRGGEIIHWSDMLAVRPEARDQGIGRALKEYQRGAAAASGATAMYWSYDPLVARNAHLNFTRLGVTVDEYVEDMYGDSASELHRGLGTDRFIVRWELRRREGARGQVEGTAVNAVPDARPLAPILSDPGTLGSTRPPALRVEIPADIVRLRDENPAEAARWRATTRRAFEWALANGYQVARFVSGELHGWYELRHMEER